MSLPETFFHQDALSCARSLVGASLLLNDCGGIIVETEAYLGENDPACHTFVRPSARAFVRDHPPGSAYVYLNYGVHFLLNFLTGPPRIHGFVLIRALQPTVGIESMRLRRPGRPDRQLCSGPGKLTAALGIDGSFHGCQLLHPPHNIDLRLPGSPPDLIADGRIGISRAAHLPYRFTDAGRQQWTSRPAKP